MVQGQKEEAFDSSIGNEVQLAKLGYEQGMLWNGSSATIGLWIAY